VLAATGSLLVVSHNPEGSEHLKSLLAADILFIEYKQLIPAALLSAVLLVFMWLRRDRLAGLVFYSLFAVAITVSVQLVGVYLVFASLIVPSLGVRNYQDKKRLPLAYAIGIGGYAIGLVLSTLFDLPSGALIVWCLALLAITVHGCGPRRAGAASVAA